MAMYTAIIAAIGAALVLTILLVILGTRGPWGSVWTLFLVLFLAMWVTGLYVNAGPIYRGVAWMPILFTGILFAILLIAVVPDSSRNFFRRLKNGKVQSANKEDNLSNLNSTEINSTTIGAFFWILVTLFALAIIAGLAARSGVIVYDLILTSGYLFNEL
jgi:hypothetical protein